MKWDWGMILTLKNKLKKDPTIQKYCKENVTSCWKSTGLAREFTRNNLLIKLKQIIFKYNNLQSENNQNK